MKRSERETSCAAAVATGAGRLGWLECRLPVLLVLAIGAVWCGALSVPLLLDDQGSVLENASIRELGSWQWLLPPSTAGETVSGRPMLNLSLALNYACGGLAPWGYHLGNVAIHLLAALVLYGLIRRTLLSCGPATGLPAEAATSCGVSWWSAAGTLAWALHPLQTGAVSYVSQRAESLAGLFVLLALYGFVRAAEPGGRGGWWTAVSLAACWLGAATKETAVAVPLLVLLYDRAFVAGSFGRALQTRGLYYLGLAASWLLLALLVAGTHGRGGSAGFGSEVTPWQYLLVQGVAIPRYIRLVFVPVGLVFDHGVVASVSPGGAAAGLVLLLLVAGAVGWALTRNRAEGFLGACFFLLLAPSSSIVPIATQTMAEHRMYLASATVIIAAGMALRRWPWLYRHTVLRRWGAMIMIVALGLATWQRNRIFQSATALWQDTVAKRPENPRAHNNLGLALRDEGLPVEAKAEFERTIALQPNHAIAHYNLGVVLLTEEDYAGALTQFTAAVAADPHYLSARLDRGQALCGLGRLDEAVAEYRTVLAEDPAAFDAATNLAAILIGTGQLDEAEQLLRRALTVTTAAPESHYHLGRVLERRGQSKAAEAEYREAIRLRPVFGAAYLALGSLQMKHGDNGNAATSFREALRLDPRSAEAHYALGNVLAQQQHFGEAMEEYRAALALDPEHLQARANLGNCFLVTGRLAEAIGVYEEVLRRHPDEPSVRQNLALAREYLGK